MTASISELAALLDDAQRTAHEVPQLDAALPIEDAYKVQHEILTKHLDRGETYIGPKLGFTSKAKMEQMGVDEIIVGFLTDAMDHPADEELVLEGFVHPRIEPELVFKLGPAVEVEDGDTVESLAAKLEAAVTHVAAGMEVIDSRYKDFKFSLSDVVADNTSAAKFVTGQWVEYPREIGGLDVAFSVDGEVVGHATTDAILGDPREAFPQLAQMMLNYGITVPAGAIILGGSMVEAQWLKPGQVIENRIDTFAPLSVRVAQ